MGITIAVAASADLDAEYSIQPNAQRVAMAVVAADAHR